MTKVDTPIEDVQRAVKTVMSCEPRIVVVDGLQYTVRQIPRLTSVRGAIINGVCNTDDLTIEINADLPAEHREELLIHETLHALNHNRQIKLKERQIESLSHALYGIGLRVPIQ